jgi:tetratricopeptide (TPR) repeat protein
VPKAIRFPRNPYALLPLAAIVVVVLSTAFFTLTANGRPNRPTSAAVQDPVTQPEPPAAGTGVGTTDPADTDNRIAFWQQRIKANPSSDVQYVYLGELYMQKGRETGDVANYALAEQALREALKLYPGNTAARADLARNLVTLHQWKEAIAEGTKLLQSDEHALGAVAIVGDASLEIGDIDTAASAFQNLHDKANSPAVTIRLARLAFLRGTIDDAIRLADQAAADAASLNASPEEQAFDLYVAGEYRWNKGDIVGADAQYQASLQTFPSYYLALAGRGRVAFANGNLDQAIAFYRSAVAIVPKPELLAYLGDLYALKGDQASAEQQYQAVDFIAKLGDTQAQVYNRELALFDATHLRHPSDAADAVRLAQAELVDRQDIYGYDAVAWALYRAGRAGEATDAVAKALALHTQDPKLLYHAGMVEIANGDPAAGRAHLEQALALNPAFDPLGAADARQALGR